MVRFPSPAYTRSLRNTPEAFFCLISGGHKILCPPFSLAQIYDIVVKMGRHNITTVKKFICLTTSVIYLAADVLFLSQPVVSSAGSLEDTIAAMQQQEAETQATISNLEKATKETRDAINSLQGQKAETEANVSSLQNQSAKLQNTINGYSSQLEVLDDEISEAEAALAEVSAQIVQLNNELNTAKEEERTQYELLKNQLKSTYERGGSGSMLMMLFTSGSIQEFLTKTEYISAIVSYDQRKIAEYQALEADIQAKTELVEAKQSELDAYQETLDEKHEEIADLTDAVKGQLDSTNSNISSEKGKLASYNQQLSDLDAKMKALEAQTAAAQAALAQQIAERLALTREDTGGAYAATATELEWLAATIQAEAGGESYTGKLAVGSVIMNRVKSSAFPNTVIGVITQNMQFASYRSGKVELIIANGPNSTCIQAAQEVLGGARVGDYLFFMTKYYADYYRISEYNMIGNHAFFYRWVTKDPEPAPVEQPAEQPVEEAPAEQPEEQYVEEQSPDEGAEQSEDYSEDTDESE